MSNMGTKMNRRQAMARLGLVAGAAYCAPLVTQISRARAASGVSEPSAPSSASPPSPSPPAASSPSPPSSPSPSMPTPSTPTSGTKTTPAASGCSQPSGAERATISRRDMRRAEAAVSRGDAKPLREIVGIVQNRHPGRVIKVGFQNQGSKNQYWLKIVSHSGRVQIVTVDAGSGVVSSVKGC